MRNSHARLFGILAVISLSLMQTVFCPAHAKSKKLKSDQIKVALECKSSINCPYFFDLFENSIDFQTSFMTAVKSQGIKIPDWVPGGVNSPMIPVIIQGKNLLIGSICEPHDCPHKFVVSYDIENKTMSGMYSPKDIESKPLWFGQPSNLLKSYIEESENGNSNLSMLLSSKNIVFPIQYDLIAKVNEPATSNKIAPHSECDSISKLAENIMNNRQHGTAMSKMMQIAEDNKLIQAMVISAYEKNRYSTEEVQTKIIEEFRDDAHLQCVKALRR